MPSYIWSVGIIRNAGLIWGNTVCPLVQGCWNVWGCPHHMLAHYFTWLFKKFKLPGQWNINLRICDWVDIVMVLLGLLGDVRKGNFTWNLKAFDEFQNLPDSPVRFRAGFSFQSAEFWQISLNYKFPVRFP